MPIKFLTIILCSIVFFAFGCSDNAKTKNCSNEQINQQVHDLNKLTTELIQVKPYLEEITPDDNLIIDTISENKLITFFSNLCEDIYLSKDFEKFSLVYWYNVKYHQLVCCSGKEATILGSNIFNLDKEKLSVGERTILYLLKKNGISKGDIEFNGFTESAIYFPKSREKFSKNFEMRKFISEIDEILEEKRRSHQ